MEASLNRRSPKLRRKWPGVGWQSKDLPEFFYLDDQKVGRSIETMDASEGLTPQGPDLRGRVATLGRFRGLSGEIDLVSVR